MRCSSTSPGAPPRRTLDRDQPPSAAGLRSPRYREHAARPRAAAPDRRSRRHASSLRGRQYFRRAIDGQWPRACSRRLDAGRNVAARNRRKRGTVAGHVSGASALEGGRPLPRRDDPEAAARGRCPTPRRGLALLRGGSGRVPARRPATVKNITIHPSAQSYDGATLKPLMQVLEHPSVKAELERFQKDGGSVTIAS